MQLKALETTEVLVYRQHVGHCVSLHGFGTLAVACDTLADGR